MDDAIDVKIKNDSTTTKGYKPKENDKHTDGKKVKKNEETELTRTLKFVLGWDSSKD